MNHFIPSDIYRFIICWDTVGQLCLVFFSEKTSRSFAIKFTFEVLKFSIGGKVSQDQGAQQADNSQGPFWFMFNLKFNNSCPYLLCSITWPTGDFLQSMRNKDFFLSVISNSSLQRLNHGATSDPFIFWNKFWLKLRPNNDDISISVNTY